MTVRIAFWIAVLAPVLSTALYAVTFARTRGFAEQVLSAALGPQRQEDVRFASAALAFGFGAVAFVLVVLSVLWIAFGFRLRAGRGWARVVLTVFAAIWALAAVSGLVNGGQSWTAGELPPGLAPPAELTALGYGQNAFALVAMVAFLVLVHARSAQRFFAAGARG